MQNHTVHLGSATPLSSQAGPRAPAHCGQTRLSAAPPPDTVPWPTCQSPPLSVFPLLGAAWHSCGRTPPPLSLLLSPSATPSTGRSKRTEMLSLLRHPLLSAPLSSATPFPTLPVPGPLPPATGSPSLARIPAERRHRPPFPCELLPEPPILTISCNFLTPSPHLSSRTSSHSTTTTRELPPRWRMPPSWNSPPASPSTRRSGVPLPSPPCPAHSL
jgi:hypothetical protein